MKDRVMIFDFDGVLVDSEIITHRVRTKEMNRMGFNIDIEKAIEVFSGVANKDLTNAIQKEYGETITSKELNNILNEIGCSLRKDLTAISDMDYACSCLKKHGIDTCIASNGDKDYIVQALNWTGLDSYFNHDQVYSSSLVKRRKPMPDLFLYVAEQFQIDPSDCIVVEDSVIGIEAAKAANMPVIGFLGGAHAKNTKYQDIIMKSKPDMIANDAFELLNLLYIKE